MKKPDGKMKISEALNSETNVKAIIPVHFGGQACDMDEILSLAKSYKWLVVFYKTNRKREWVNYR